MTSSSHHSSSFSVHHAFVVQFASPTTWDAGNPGGRIEHIVSGQSTRFQSLEALIAFVAQVLEACPASQCEEPEHSINHMFSPSY